MNYFEEWMRQGIIGVQIKDAPHRGYFIPAWAESMESTTYKHIVKILAETKDLSQELREEIVKDVTLIWHGISIRIGDIGTDGTVSYAPRAYRTYGYKFIDIWSGKEREVPTQFVQLFIRADRKEKVIAEFLKINKNCSISQEHRISPSINNRKYGEQYREKTANQI